MQTMWGNYVKSAAFTSSGCSAHTKRTNVSPDPPPSCRSCKEPFVFTGSGDWMRDGGVIESWFVGDTGAEGISDEAAFQRSGDVRQVKDCADPTDWRLLERENIRHWSWKKTRLFGYVTGVWALINFTIVQSLTIIKKYIVYWYHKKINTSKG